MKDIKIITGFIKQIIKRICFFAASDVYFGKSPSVIARKIQKNFIVFFPYTPNLLCCGLAGIVSFHNKAKKSYKIDTESLIKYVDKIDKNRLSVCKKNKLSFEKYYLGGKDVLGALLASVRSLKNNESFYKLFIDKEILKDLTKLQDRIRKTIDSETKLFSKNLGRLNAKDVNTISQHIEQLKDIGWCLSFEVAGNIVKIEDLIAAPTNPLPYSTLLIFKKINSVLNSIDFLEVRGRDSAGISLMFTLDNNEFERFVSSLKEKDLYNTFISRQDQDVLVNKGISLNETEDEKGNKYKSISFTYKFAAEIGKLGDNTCFIRNQIKEDYILQMLSGFDCKYHTVSAHTRWASVGAINEPNCHPVDNKTAQNTTANGIIHVCLNGDIDNYQELKRKCEKSGILIHPDITTDTKIIPLIIEKYLNNGNDILEAFRLAVNDFEGSHAISMHTDLAPGKLFLAQKGSGQAIFVGVAEDLYIAASEVYGFVEETSDYLKVDGEKVIEGINGRTQGQIYVISQDSKGGLDGISAIYYDGTVIDLGKEDIKHTEITIRDIDRQGFSHYFLKEISESYVSVEKTLLNRWKITNNNDMPQYVLSLDESIFSKSLQEALTDNGNEGTKIKRVLFIGQGTAGVAAQACSDILNYYMDDPSFYVSALKASELSGFTLNDFDDPDSMKDTLIIAISQSGTTTDTNKTVDMVKERGAHTLAIVNRRDSDLTFKVDGVMYTSSGRDIEMSVASTKAFYSQIIAGALLGLNIAALKGRRDEEFISDEIKRLLEIPKHMKKVLAKQDKIKASSQRLAPVKTYWAAVGSGPNKVSADEIRIKLSELCYKTISSDYVEDKKHIDLSSEPLIIVCAAGTKGNVISDIIKDAAIFHAHKSSVVVIADEGEDRFSHYAEDVLHVPAVSQHLAPILNTLVGHIWGYYAALAINEGSMFLHTFRDEIQSLIDSYAEEGQNIYEVILENNFKEKSAAFYKEFRAKVAQNRFPKGLAKISDLTLLLKYLLGRLPVSDFELDFGKKGTALNMINSLFEYLGESINNMARPVDAIKHQAKTVTVGTSRISEKIEGMLFDALSKYDLNISQLSNRNVLVMKNLQGIVSKINGAILYKVAGLNLLGEPTDESTIEVVAKDGALKSLPSRVEKDTRLKGTKKIIVRQGNIFIGMGRKDDRTFIVIPVISASHETPNTIEYLLLLNISLKESAPLETKIKALGGKYEHIKNIVQENNIAWEDKFLELVDMRRLFGRSAEKIAESIVANL